MVARNPDRFQVFALVAGRNVELLAQQIERFRPQAAVVASEHDLNGLTKTLEARLPRSAWPQLGAGAAARAAVAVAAEVDVVLSAIVGVAGLEATFAAIQAGKRIGLANKETLVACGELVMKEAKARSAEIIPVDSEHNGAHQCFRCGERREVSRLLLTASGGPFLDTPREDLAFVTPAQALKHPTWKMGQRITINSATLMNKGFEVIEACWLFDLSPGEVDVVVHPQSTVHAMVEFSDGSIIAQLSATDMRMPIQYALMYPERHSAAVSRLDWTVARQWSFSPPDYSKFPLLNLAYQALKVGGSAGCILNASDEVAVDAFLKSQISFSDMATVVEETLARVPQRTPTSVTQVLAIDEESRAVTRQIVAQRAGGMSRGMLAVAQPKRV